MATYANKLLKKLYYVNCLRIIRRVAIFSLFHDKVDDDNGKDNINDKRNNKQNNKHYTGSVATVITCWLGSYVRKTILIIHCTSCPN